MANHPSRDELRSELRRQRLPRAYITRLLAELDDHYEDLVEERSTSMGAARKLQTESISQKNLHTRLGEPAQLALFAAEQYHSRSFWGRHPLLTFGFAPLPLLVALWIAVVFCMAQFGSGLGYVIEHWFGLPPERWEFQDHLLAQAIVMALATWLAIIFPMLSVAALMCRTARRNVVKWRWPILTCGLLSLVAGFLSVGYRVALAADEGRIVVGFDYNDSMRWALLTYLPKFVVAMGIGLLLVKRAQRQFELAS